MAKKATPPDHTLEPKSTLATPPGSSKIDAGGDSTGPQAFIVVDGETCKLRANASGSMGCLYFGKSVVYKTYSEERFEASVLSIEKGNLQKLTEIKKSSLCFPKYLGSVMHENREYLKVELVDGRPLSELLSKLSCEKFLHILIKLAQGLVELRECNIIHRDLHAGNILYDQDADRVIVIDFGISQDLDDKKSEVSERPDDTTYKGRSDIRPTRKHSPQNRDIRFRDPFAVGRLIEKYLDLNAKTNANTFGSDQAVADTKPSENSRVDNPAADALGPTLVTTSSENFLSQLRDDLLDLGSYPDRCVDANELLRRLVAFSIPELAPSLNVPSRRESRLTGLGSRLGRAVYKGSIKRSLEKQSRRAFLVGLGGMAGFLLGHQFRFPSTTVEQRFARANAWFALGKRFRDDGPPSEQESRNLELQQICTALRGSSFGVDEFESDSVVEWQKKLFQNALIELNESLVTEGMHGDQIAKLCDGLSKDENRNIQMERLKFLGELLGKYGDVAGSLNTRESVYSASLKLRRMYSEMVAEDADPIARAGALRDLGLAHKNLVKTLIDQHKKDRSSSESEDVFLEKLLVHQLSAAEHLKDAWDELDNAKDSTDKEKNQGNILYSAGWTAFDPRDREGLWWNSKFHAMQESPIEWLKSEPQALRIVTRVLPDQVHMWEWGMFSLDCNNPNSRFLPTGVNHEQLLEVIPNLVKEHFRNEKMLQIFALVFLRLMNARQRDAAPDGLKEKFVFAAKNEIERAASEKAFESVSGWWTKRAEDFPPFSTFEDAK